MQLALRKFNVSVLSSLLLLILSSTNAEAGCKDIFKRVVDASKTYVSQVWESRGARLIVKEASTQVEDVKLLVFFERPIEPKNDLQQQLSGNQTERSRLGKVYKFRPFYAVKYHLVDRPVSYVTEKLFSRRLTITLPVLLVGLIIKTNASDLIIQTVYEMALEENKKTQIENDSALYDELIKYDYRYRNIYTELTKAMISPSEARIAARNRFRYLQHYYAFMEKSFNHQDPSSNHDVLLSSPLFSDIRKIYFEGVPESDAFVYQEDFSKEISETQLNELFETRFYLLTNYEVLCSIIDSHCGKQKEPTTPEFDSIKDAILSNTFVQELFELYDQKKISKNELLMRLHEDAYWRSRLREWQILKISKRKKEDGLYTDEPLSYKDIVKQTEQELGL